MQARSWILALLLCGSFVSVPASPLDSGEVWGALVVPFLHRYCLGCHDEEEPPAGLDFSVYRGRPEDQDPIRRERRRWEAILDRVRNGGMPPEEAPQPTDEERQAVVRVLDDALSLEACEVSDPGRVTLRRLNRTEYANAVDDLLGVAFNVSDHFPADDVGYGFDNNGDVLSLSPVLLEKYMEAAEIISADAFASSRGGADAPQQELTVCRPASETDWDSCARRVLEPLARRAFRRPLRQGELEALLRIAGLAQEGREKDEPIDVRFQRGVRLALQAILVSPNFLFQIVEGRTGEAPDGVYPLSTFELASRLSFFLWSRPPDDELLDLAATGGLLETAALEAQVRRMLRDVRASALSDSFAVQWLELRRLDTASPDPESFPDYDENLRRASRRETELFFAAMVRGDLSVLRLLDADFSFLNDRLAKHYDIPGVEGAHFRRVPLRDGRRGGLITQASVLTTTSNPTRTSPVKRGKWILEQILGTPPPPPPPAVENLREDGPDVPPASLRERLEQHRQDALCNSCHQSMDPLGFALENYDATGAWRARDGKFPIDSAGVLPDGEFFDGPIELKALLLRRKRSFVRCLTEKMLTYALGRGVEYYDDCAVERIVRAVEEDDYRFSRLAVEIVKSVPFQKRRGVVRSP